MIDLTKTYVTISVSLTAALGPICELACVKITDGKIVDTFSTFVRVDDENELNELQKYTSRFTGVYREQLIGAPALSDVMQKFENFCKGAILVPGSADCWDEIVKALKQCGLSCNYPIFKADILYLTYEDIFGIADISYDKFREHLKNTLDIEHIRTDCLGNAVTTAKLFLYIADATKDNCKEKDCVVLQTTYNYTDSDEAD